MNIEVYGVSSNSPYISFKDKAGIKLCSDKIIITRPLADKLKIKPQETIKVISKLDSKEYDINIDNIA